jgi:hypothetical protein
MNWYKKAQTRKIPKETWVDAKGQVAYIKGVPHEEPRLTWPEFREFMTSNTGTVTKTLSDGSQITYHSPFKRFIPEKTDAYRNDVLEAGIDYELSEQDDSGRAHLLNNLVWSIKEKHPLFDIDIIENDIWDAAHGEF